MAEAVFGGNNALFIQAVAAPYNLQPAIVVVLIVIDRMILKFRITCACILIWQNMFLKWYIVN